MPTHRPRLFIGSSSEGRELAKALDVELGDAIEVHRWDINVFEPGGFTLDSLIAESRQADFAVLIATADDVTVSRGESSASARDNIILEFGLFAGAIGRERTYMLASGDPKLPTDIAGFTRLSYKAPVDGNLRRAVTAAAMEIMDRVQKLGSRTLVEDASVRQGALNRELALLCSNARAQGWTARETTTALRLRSPRGTKHTLTKGAEAGTREELRSFAAALRAAGLRIIRSLRRPIDESPL